MTITLVKKRRGSVCAVYIDEEYIFDIDKETAVLNNIKAGKEITDEELVCLIKESNNKIAKRMALSFLSRRDYSKGELIDKIKKILSEESAKNAADKMVELGLIDDEKFCKRYSEDLLFRKNYSKSRTAYELFKKRLDKEIVEQTLNNMDINERERISKLVEEKYINRLDDEKSRKKVINALKRLGHSWDDIRFVLKDYLSEED